MAGINSAHDFWEKIVQPDYQEFTRDQTNLRLAAHAALSLYHIHDWVFEDYKGDTARIFECKSKSQFLDHIRQQECADFELLRGLANSHKHFRLDRGQPAVASSTQVSIRPTGWGESAYGEGPYGGSASIVVDIGNGQIRHFTAIAQNVWEMWCRLFRSQNW